jgi:preprotein translocase subunit SecA
MDKLRSSTNIVQYSQKNPYQVYAEQGSAKFNEMCHEIAFQVLVALLNNMNLIPQQVNETIVINGNTFTIPQNIPKILRDAIISQIKTGNTTLNDAGGFDVELKMDDILYHELDTLDSMTDL